MVSQLICISRVLSSCKKKLEKSRGAYRRSMTAHAHCIFKSNRRHSTAARATVDASETKNSCRYIRNAKALRLRVQKAGCLAFGPVPHSSPKGQFRCFYGAATAVRGRDDSQEGTLLQLQTDMAVSSYYAVTRSARVLFYLILEFINKTRTALYLRWLKVYLVAFFLM